jgi:quercetin dioxygenase-like cupin family protein
MKKGQFRIASEIPSEIIPIASLRWYCKPKITGAAQLAVVEASFQAGQGHSFHQHPEQEELLYVVSGRIEQWIGQEKRILQPGDAAFIPAGLVHASFNAGTDVSTVLAIFGPCVGDGFGVAEMSDVAPWNKLRLSFTQ